MNDFIYNKKVICPVCNSEIEVTKVKTKGFKVKSRDTDMCVHYEDFNPLFYDVWVCEHCGYAALQDKFETVMSRDIPLIRNGISSHWSKRSFTGERDIDNVIEAFKLALLNLKVRNAKSSEVAKICLRIAWLYRFKGDPKETDFLNFTIAGYSEAFEKERFPIDKLDEYTCMYIIAELYRRVKKYDEATQWFSRIMSSMGARNNIKIMDMAREQFQLLKEETGKAN